MSLKWAARDRAEELLGVVLARVLPSPAPPWRPPSDRPYAALGTVEDYERCARGAHVAVRYVRVLAHATDPRIKPGQVEVRVRGPWLRKLRSHELAIVHAVVAAHHPVNVRLRVRS